MCETMANGSKRLSFSLEKKMEIIKAVEERPGIKKAELAREFGIPASTLWTILKNRKDIVTCSKSYVQSRKRMRHALHVDIERAMLLWLQKMMAKELPVTGPSIRAKANELAMELGRNDFKANCGWLCRFKRRHQLLITKHQHTGAERLIEESRVRENPNQTAHKEQDDEELALDQSMDEAYEDEMMSHSPSTAEAFHCLSRLQDYFNTRQESRGEDFLRIAGLEASLVQCRKSDQQSKITDFFHP